MLGGQAILHFFLYHSVFLSIYFSGALRELIKKMKPFFSRGFILIFLYIIVEIEKSVKYINILKHHFRMTRQKKPFQTNKLTKLTHCFDMESSFYISSFFLSIQS